MADCSCDRNAKALELKAGRKVLETPTDPRQSDAVEEHRAMSCWAYNIRSCGLMEEQNGTFKSIGELAAELVRKAGAQ